MNAYLNIGEISLLFVYQFEDFFQGSLHQYEMKYIQEPDHILEVVVVDEIQEVVGGTRFVFNNKVRVTTQSHTYIMAYYQDRTMKHRIVYSNDYKHIKIELHQSIGSKLAEHEYVLSGMMFFEIAIHHRYLPLHASAIVHNNQTFLLCGPSTSGKSTQTKYFLDLVPDCIVINEDKPLVFQKEGKLFVCGSPWSGKHVINQNLILPLGFIFFLDKANNTSIVPLSKKEKLKQLLRNSHRPGVEPHIDNAFKIIEAIIQKSPIYQFNCINEISSSRYLKQFMEEHI